VDTLVIVTRFTLAAVFAVAGVAKLADGESSRLAVSGTGLPAWATPLAAVLLPVVEVCVAGALLAAPIRAAAVSAVVLMAVLNAGLAVRVLRDENGGCNCFGRARETTVGWRTVARNLALAAAAVFLYAAALH